MGVRAYDKAIHDGLFVVIKYVCWWAKSHTRSDINSKTGVERAGEWGKSGSKSKKEGAHRPAGHT